jgi:hypothetical protein
LDVFTCWPPGPPLAEKRHSSSVRGIAQLDDTRSEAGSTPKTVVLVKTLGTPGS